MSLGGGGGAYANKKWDCFWLKPHGKQSTPVTAERKKLDGGMEQFPL